MYHWSSRSRLLSSVSVQNNLPYKCCQMTLNYCCYYTMTSGTKCWLYNYNVNQITLYVVLVSKTKSYQKIIALTTCMRTAFNGLFPGDRVSSPWFPSPCLFLTCVTCTVCVLSEWAKNLSHILWCNSYHVLYDAILSPAWHVTHSQ